MKRWGPYQRKDGYIFSVERIDGKICTIMEHKEVLEKKLGRKLMPSEVTHHKDGNVANNHPDNLEVMERSQHSRDHHSEAEMVTIVCVECGKEKEILARQLRHNQGTQGKAGPFCGRSCSGRHNARQAGMVEHG